MNTFLVILFSVMGVMYVLAGWSIYDKYKKLKYKYKNGCRVYHRLDDHMNLQYSIDKKNWEYIYGYDEKFNYGDYVGPALRYMNIDKNDINLYNVWCNHLNTLQKCQEWNNTALHLYTDKIREYIKN